MLFAKNILQTTFFVLAHPNSRLHICSMKLYSQQNPLPMIRLSNYMTVLQKLSLVFLLAVALPFGAKAQVGITIVTTPTNPQPGDVVTADFLVHNFQDILSMQFSVQWPTSSLSYLATNNYNLPGLTTSSFGAVQASTGKLVFSWVDLNIVGVSVSDCDRIFSISFTAVTSDVPDIVISNDPTFMEVIDGSGSVVALEQNNICGGAGAITGNVFHDLDNDCLPTLDEPGLHNWKIKFERSGSTFYRTTNPNGDFSFYGQHGDYDVSLVLPQNNLWTTCQTTQTATIVEGEQITANFAAQPLEDCPQLTVDLGAPFLRRCFQSTYNVQYCNQGTLTAEDAIVELTLDPFLSYVGSSIPFATQNGQVYTFPIGDVAVGQCGSFSVQVMVSCDAELGQAHCSEAHIFPDDICESANPLWDGSILAVTGICDGDSVRFIITNNGADMAQPAPFIVIEDDMVNFEGPGIQLGAGQSYAVAVPANGSTWRMELDNADTDPFNGTTAASVEGCGVNGSGSFSLGFVTQFPQGDESPFIDTDCQPNIGSYDPNDKIGYPNGYCAAHFIEPNTDIEYQIRFQNTGTDTAFTVVVTDTLPLPLNPATVQPGASSHPYDFELLGNGVVQFTFNDIMLPDSNVNETGSHGFVKFSIAQAANNPDGTVIANQAGIVFDFNEPVYTNFYTHTVADDFVQSAGADGDLSVSGQVRTWYGAPVEDVEVTLVPTCPVYSDLDGSFEFLELDTADYTLLVSKPILNQQEGVTVLDLLVLPKIILGLTSNLYSSAFQRVAAELNGNAGITTFDLVKLKDIIVGLNVPSIIQNWRFAPKDYQLPEPDPLSGIPMPGSLQIDNLTESLDSVDWVAVKPGNVIVESMVDSSVISPFFYLVPHAKEGTWLKVDIKVDGLQALQGFQFGLSWDENVLDFAHIENGALDQPVFNANNPGELQLFVVGNNDTLQLGTTVFTLVFDVVAPFGSNTQIEFDTALMDFQVVVEPSIKLAGATFENATVTISSIDEPVGNAAFLFNIAPNPVRGGDPVFLEIKTTAAQALDLQLFSVSGQLLQHWEKDAQPGNTGFTLHPSLTKGAYFMKITNGDGYSQTAKLVVY